MPAPPLPASLPEPALAPQSGGWHRLELAGAMLVIPLALLLCAQWPLRELVQAGATKANDLAQIVFAFYMALAVSAGSRQGVHLSTGHMPRVLRSPQVRARVLLMLTAPWSAFLLWTSAKPVWNSLMQLEHFPESFNPGYFLVKLALWMLTVLVLVDSLGACIRRRAKDGG